MDNNISDFRVEIPIGAEAYILVEAPGYGDWEMVELVVELIPVGHRVM